MTYQRTSYEPTTAFAVANWFIERAEAKNMPLAYKKLQYCAYLSYGWYFAYYDIPLFADRFYVGQFGPVAESLNTFYKDCRHSTSITLKAYSLEDANDDGMLEKEIHCIVWPQSMLDELSAYEQAERKKAEKDLVELLEIVWNAYFHLTESQLMSITCRDGTPWGKITDQFDDPYGVSISVDEIKKYFTMLLKNYDRVTVG